MFDIQISERWGGWKVCKGEGTGEERVVRIDDLLKPLPGISRLKTLIEKEINLILLNIIILDFYNLLLIQNIYKILAKLESRIFFISVNDQTSDRGWEGRREGRGVK